MSSTNSSSRTLIPRGSAAGSSELAASARPNTTSALHASAFIVAPFLEADAEKTDRWRNAGDLEVRPDGIVAASPRPCFSHPGLGKTGLPTLGLQQRATLVILFL
jgi:hypothetical protein